MKLEKIKIKNFRNLDETTVDPDDRLNLIFGPNGSGKTNFCEAIHFVSTGDNIKGTRQRELINWNADHTLIQLEIASEDQLTVYLQKGEAKEIRINSKKKSQSELSDLFPTHTFIPEDLYISKGSPKKRRTLVNRHLGQLDTDYDNLLTQYNSELKKKNTLLKKNELNEEFLQVLEERLVDLGAEIIQKRASYLKELNERLPEVYGRFVRNGARLSLNYVDEILMKGSGEDLVEYLSDRIEENRQKELEQETTVVGPHRDKFEYRLEGKNLRKYGSQGELRTAVIATYLSYLKLYEERYEEWPVLILDDILSELDRKRGERLLENLPEGPQIFMTTATRNPSFKKLTGEFSVLRITGGSVEEK